jgi:SP family sugar:H+ symporter-like MFS transporter
MNYFRSQRSAENNKITADVASPSTSMSISPADPTAGDVNRDVQHLEKADVSYGRVPRVTVRTLLMALLVAMGGFIFGYDTGQISGFLEMNVFLERFGEPGGPSTPENPMGYHFTNARSGLIVGLVSLHFLASPYQC